MHSLSTKSYRRCYCFVVCIMSGVYTVLCLWPPPIVLSLKYILLLFLKVEPETNHVKPLNSTRFGTPKHGTIRGSSNLSWHPASSGAVSHIGKYNS